MILLAYYDKNNKLHYKNSGKHFERDLPDFTFSAAKKYLLIQQQKITNYQLKCLKIIMSTMIGIGIIISLIITLLTK